MTEYNFIFAGKVGVGKSSLFSLIKTGLAPDVESNLDGRIVHYDMGLERLEHETMVKGRAVKVNIWDTGGQERHHSMTANYYRHAHAVILVYDLTAEDTLYKLSDWVKEARKNSRWNERLVLALWGNKHDSKEQVIDDKAVLAFMATHHIQLELSAKVSTLRKETVESALQTLIEHVDKWFNSLSNDELAHDTFVLEEMENKPQKKCRC